MGKESPVYYDERAKVWNVFLYDDVKRVLDDKEYFSSKSPRLPGSSIGKTLINTDPPQHTDLRSIVNRAFTPRVMKEWELQNILIGLKNGQTFLSCHRRASAKKM